MSSAERHAPAPVEPIVWAGDHLKLLDQRLLPAREIYREYRSAEAVADAIANMVVRGAPAIGIAAAYAMALAARHTQDPSTLALARQQLAQSRPTAVNLFWALGRAQQVIDAGQAIADQLEQLARRIHREDIANNQQIGALGAALLPDGATLYTHCNAGALATGGYGTALGVIRSAFAGEKLARVYAGETRPWMQGARLTAWELLRENIPVTLCTEAAAGSILKQRGVDWVIVGADRIAANGDVANKIGTYNLAVLARHHGVKMMVAAPSSTFDLALADGEAIPIEERGAVEVTHLGERPTAPANCPAANPAFDVTPAALIDAIVTERGVIHQPDKTAIARLID